MSLAEFQDNFQSAILTGATEIVAALSKTPRFDRATRLGVYVNAYRLRLAEFISKDYPILRDAIGDEEFEALAIAYIDHAPSRHRNARWYASSLPEFMDGHPPWQERRDWLDLARFERALNDAFDAADAPVLDMSAFRAIAPQQAPCLRLELHPSVRSLELRAGTAQRYACLVGKEETTVEVEGCERVLFWRQNEQCFHRRLADDESLALTEAHKGRRFGEICSLIAFRDAGTSTAKLAAGFLLRWFEDGLVSAISL